MLHSRDLCPAGVLPQPIGVTGLIHFTYRQRQCLQGSFRFGNAEAPSVQFEDEIRRHKANALIAVQKGMVADKTSAFIGCYLALYMA